MQVTKSPYNQTYTCQMWSQPFPLVNYTPGFETYFGNGFQINGILLASNLAAVFDQYRVREIEVWITSGFNNSTEANPEFAPYVSYVDLDNAVAPTSLAYALCAAGAVTTGLVSGHYHRWQPSVTTDVYAAGTGFGAYAQLGRNNWIDCSNLSVIYYGLKGAVGPSQAVGTLMAMVRFTTEWRGVSV